MSFVGDLGGKVRRKIRRICSCSCNNFVFVGDFVGKKKKKKKFLFATTLYFVGDFVGGEEVEEEAILSPLSSVGDFVGNEEEGEEEEAL